MLVLMVSCLVVDQHSYRLFHAASNLLFITSSFIFIFLHDLRSLSWCYFGFCILFCFKINVLQQLVNVSSHEFLQPYFEAGLYRFSFNTVLVKQRCFEYDVWGRLFVHGMWFDVYNGDDYLFSKDKKRFVLIDVGLLVFTLFFPVNLNSFLYPTFGSR